MTLHWLSLTFFINPARAMSHFLTEFLDIELEGEMEWSEHFFNLQRGARGYKAIFIGPHEVRFYAYPDSGVHCHLEIPGTLIEMMGTPHVIEYLKSLNDQDFDWRPTRIDVAFDNVPFSPHACYEALARGDIRTRAHDDSWDWRENKYGHTFNLGSRKSGRFIRVYDRRGPTRLEIELKEGWASALADVLTLDDHAAWIHTSLGYVRDFVDFVDARLGGSNASRAPLLPWWESFVGDVGKIRLSREADAEAHLLARTQRYLERLLPTLYVMRHGLDISLDSIVDSTAEATSDRHRRKLGLLKQLAGRV